MTDRFNGPASSGLTWGSALLLGADTLIGPLYLADRIGRISAKLVHSPAVISDVRGVTGTGRKGVQSRRRAPVKTAPPDVAPTIGDKSDRHSYATPDKQPSCSRASGERCVTSLCPGLAEDRPMAGKPFTLAEQDAYLGSVPRGEPAELAMSEWHTAIGSKAPADSSTYRHLASPEAPVDYILNCPADAFRTAIKTYQNRVAIFGEQSQATQSWLAAQKTVFSNCAAGQDIPDAAPAAVPKLIRQDRAYQIAAAYFYSTQFDRAAQSFDTIARDPDSPWHSLAPYLAARAYLRKATLAADEASAQAAFSEASGRVDEVLAKPGLKAIHPAAQAMKSYIVLRQDPNAARKWLEQRLMSGKSERNLLLDLLDYQWLLDQVPGVPAQIKKGQNAAKPDGDGGLTDWIETVQADASCQNTGADVVAQCRDSALRHALSIWGRSKRDSWALASLLIAKSSGQLPADLLKSVGLWDESKPGYQTAQLRMLLLQERDALGMDRSEQEKARSTILLTARQLLASGQFPPDGRNALREIILRHTDRFEEAEAVLLLEDLPDIQFYEFEANTPEEAKPSATPQWILWNEATQWLNQEIPVSVMQQILKRRKISPALWNNLAIASWTRAIALQDYTHARELTPYLQEAVPVLTEPLERFQKASQSEMEFAAADLLATHPAMVLDVFGSDDRSARVATSEFAHHNWWCFPRRDATNNDSLRFAPRTLSAQEREDAHAEKQKQEALDNGTNYLARIVLARAQTHPKDPRLPQDLHYLIRSTKGGCTDQESSALSKTMFRLLHTRYKASEWAKRTPYHY